MLHRTTLSFSRQLLRSNRVPVMRMSGRAPKGYDILGDTLEGEEMRSAIRAFGDRSFKVNNVVVRQSVLLFPHSFLAWNVHRIEDITIDSLAPFTLLYPTIDILFIGCGKTAPSPPRLAPEIHQFFREQGIVLEVTTSAHAATTFNILNAEHRHVGAALLTMMPPDDVFQGHTLIGARKTEVPALL